MSKTKAVLTRELAVAQHELLQRGRQVQRLRQELGMHGPAQNDAVVEAHNWVRPPANVIEFRERLRAALPKRKRYA